MNVKKFIENNKNPEFVIFEASSKTAVKCTICTATIELYGIRALRKHLNSVTHRLILQ